MEWPRVKRWLHRYGPAELCGIATALLGSYGVHALTGNEIAAAFGGSIGETLGFYSVIIGREIRRHREAARVAELPYGPRGWFKTFSWLILEFGPAEILDTGIIRPFTMGLGTRLLGRALGIPLGKLAADVTFYVPVIAIYEWRRRREPHANAPGGPAQ
jgi:hypothetical protein